jgi:hypothetical protein
MLAVASLLLGAEQAQAQTSPPCGNIGTQPFAIYQSYLEQFEDSFPLGESECTKLAKNAVAVCRMAVRETAQCIDQLIASLFKSAKTACNGNSECIQEAKEEREQLEQEQDDIVEDALEGGCDANLDEAVFDACFNG